jgi:hypothetical protein
MPNHCKHVADMVEGDPPRLSSAVDAHITESGKVDKPPFLLGEEVLDEIELSDGKGIFINNVLETAEWCVLWNFDIHLYSERTLGSGRSPGSYHTITRLLSRKSTSSRLSTDGATLRMGCSPLLPINSKNSRCMLSIPISGTTHMAT